MTEASRYTVEAEPPDTLFVTWVGSMTKELLDESYKRQKMLAKDWKQIYYLVDFGKLTGMPAEARRAAIEHTQGMPIVATAIFGASFPIRTLMNLMSRAAAALAGASDSGAVSYFATEAEARAWLATERARLGGSR